MESFCEEHSPGMFQNIYEAIFNDEKREPSLKRRKLQRTRVVAVLHNLSYFRNQKNNRLQKANGLNLKFGGASYDALMSGQVMGYSVHPNSVRNYQKELAKKNQTELRKMVKEAIQKKSFILLMEDDIHFIHASQQLSSGKTSTAWHMCTALIDVQESIHAIPRPVQQLHRTVLVATKAGVVKQCRGGISTNAILDHSKESIGQFFQSSYMATLTLEHRTIKMDDARKNCENLRYNTVAFGGWTIIRDQVLQLFGPLCKDTEYMLLFHLFDELLPLLFFLYNTIFRGGDFDQWLDVLTRVSLMFITFRRRNYDKATLCQLSDIIHHLCFQPYYFPTFDTTLDQRSLPLGYAFPGNEPDILLACDRKTCVDNKNFEDTTRLTCGHTFHKGCLGTHVQASEHSYAQSVEVRCQICYPLAGDDDDEDPDDGDSEEEGDDDDDDTDENLNEELDDDDEDVFDEDVYMRQVKAIQKRAIARFAGLKRHEE